MRGLNTEHRLRRLSATNCLVDAIAQRRSRMRITPRLTCCMGDPTLVKPPHENNTIATLTNACGYTACLQLASYDARKLCGKLGIWCRYANQQSCEASADASFDGTLLGKFGKIRKPCNLRPSGAPCDAIWIDSYVDENRSE